MKNFMVKLQNREYAQQVFVEIVGDITMVVVGLLLGYIFMKYIR